MDVVTGSERLPLGPGERAVAIGNFDGVHLGHRQVLERLAVRARERGVPAWVYTFDPPPTMVVAPERHQPRLVTLGRKLELLDGMGVSGVVVEAFTPAFAALSAGSFASTILWGRLRASVVVVGWDFRFGAGRGGDADALRNAAPGLDVEQVEPFLREGSPVSSSRIRRLIASGAVVEAAALLGRPHRLSGTVVHGDARGRSIGVPTANLACDVECTPAAGVYAVRVGWPDRSTDSAGGAGPGRLGVMNVGVRPTFGGSGLRIEAHVLDWQGDLYGQQVHFDILARIRDERAFSSVDALVAQIHDDVAVARRLA